MNTPVFNRIIAVMSIAAFSAYWGATFFFTMPDNYLKIKALAYDKVFQSIFYQQWSFFAPPPTYNDFLYFEFADTLSGEVQTFEVLS